MNTKQLSQMLARATKDVRALNRSLSEKIPCLSGGRARRAVRIRQDSRPVLNKLESRWLLRLQNDFPQEKFRFQDRRYKLANGVWYKPDITCHSHRWPETGHRMETCWECKGPKQMKNMARSMLVIKMAAHQWPEIRWVLVWFDGGWNEQEVLP